MKIAVLTFHRAYNCGAMLQAWALKTVLGRMGHKVEFPDCNRVGERCRVNADCFDFSWRGFLRSSVSCFLRNLLSVPVEDIRRARYRRFRKAHLPESPCRPDMLGRYDLVVVGSDQVWNREIAGSSSPLFFGEGIPAGVRRIAYSVSVGDGELPADDLEKVLAAVARFEAVSVRETFVQKHLSGLAGKDIAVTADPTLLLEAGDYAGLCEGVAVPGEPYLLMYDLYGNAGFVAAAHGLAGRLGVRCVVAPCYQFSRFAAPRGVVYSVSPDRLVALARGAKYILAGSFHGTVMGLLFNKPFISLREKAADGMSRQGALLGILGCAERLATPETPLGEMEALLRAEVPGEVYERLGAFRAESLSWLESAMALST